MLTVFIVSFIIIAILVFLSYPNHYKEKPYTETICGNCGGPDCIVGCDKSLDVTEAANKASDNLDKEFCKSIGIDQPISTAFIKIEKERLITDDEIRYTAYLIASEDNFTKPSEIYWFEAEKRLREGNK